jgi:hypothetical protein
MTLRNLFTVGVLIAVFVVFLIVVVVICLIGD